MYNSTSSSSVQASPYFPLKSFGDTEALSLSKIDNARFPCAQNTFVIQQQFPDPNVDNNTVNRFTLPLHPNPSARKSLAMVGGGGAEAGGGGAGGESQESSSPSSSNSSADSNTELIKKQNQEDIQQNISEHFPTFRPSKPPISPTRRPLMNKNNNALLPVMDFRFNVREICKQLILLEDHLTHGPKRCMDCCIKHFLTIEAFSEELLTLDNTNLIIPNSDWHTLKNLPVDIRHLQYIFIQNIRDGTLDEKTIHSMVQELRRIRKQYMVVSFDIVFPSSAHGNNKNISSCSSSSCSLKL
jgi:hypothetical protein